MPYRHHDDQECTIKSGASVSLTSPRYMSRGSQRCTDEDLMSDTDKGELEIKERVKSSLKVRERTFILSVKELAHLPKLRYSLISLCVINDAGTHVIVDGGRIIMCDPDLMFKNQSGTYGERDSRPKPRHRASVALFRQGDRMYETVDIDPMHSCYNHSNACLLITTTR